MLTIVPRRRPEAHRLTIALDSFLLAQEAAHHTPATLDYYRDTLRRFIVYLISQRVDEPEAITATHIRAFLLSLDRAGLSSGTVHAYARAIKAWLNWLVREGELDESPMRRVQMPKREKRILPALSREDVKALLAACDKTPLGHRNRAIILCLLDSGCRASEFCALRIRDVDMKSGMVRVHGKGHKERMVRFGAKARMQLLKSIGLREPDEPLWLSYTKTGQATDMPLTTGGLRMLMVALKRKTGVAVTAHAFRRTFALWSLRSGMDLFSLQMLMGHADLQVLRRYLAQQPSDLAAAHRAHGPVDTLL